MCARPQTRFLDPTPLCPTCCYWKHLSVCWRFFICLCHCYSFSEPAGFWKVGSVLWLRVGCVCMAATEPAAPWKCRVLPCVCADHQLRKTYLYQAPQECMRNECNLGHHSRMFPWHFLGKAWLLCEVHGGRAGSGYRHIPGAAQGVIIHIRLWKVIYCWEHPFPPPLLHHCLQTTHFSIALPTFWEFLSG